MPARRFLADCSIAPSPVNDAIMLSACSSKGPTCAPSSASLSVSTAATIRPVSASRPMWSFFQDRRLRVPCFSASHSPAPQSFNPVLSTSRWTGSPRGPAAGRGTASVSARRLRVEWSGTARSRPSKCRVWGTAPDADQPLRLAQGKAEHGPQGQRRLDRQRGVPGLPAPGGARRRPPPLDGFGAEPDCQAPALPQAGVVLTPVRHLALLLGNVVPAVLVQL